MQTFVTGLFCGKLRFLPLRTFHTRSALSAPPVTQRTPLRSRQNAVTRPPSAGAVIVRCGWSTTSCGDASGAASRLVTRSSRSALPALKSRKALLSKSTPATAPSCRGAPASGRSEAPPVAKTWTKLSVAADASTLSASSGRPEAPTTRPRGA